jgi:hypothetical protein
MQVRLLQSSWLKRVLRLETDEGAYEIVYSGRGLGFESVFVDGSIAERASGLWFVPLFIFPLGSRMGAVEVRVWPWLTIRSFHLLVEDEEVYKEGSRKPFLIPGWAGMVRLMRGTPSKPFDATALRRWCQDGEGPTTRPDSVDTRVRKRSNNIQDQ